MNLKLDTENYRDRTPSAPIAATGAEAAPTHRRSARGAAAINWKIVRALGLALLVWALVIAVLLSF